MYDEDLNALIVLPPGYPYDDVRAVAGILQKAEVLVPGYIPPPAGLLNPDCFLFETRVGRVEFLILPDRNIVSRIARVGRGEAVDEMRRSAAALMAFAQCLNLSFEPAIAFHELAHRDGNQVAHEELRSFRAADKARPEDWLDVALGRTETFRSPLPLPKVAERDLAKPLRRWNRNYILALKVAELELRSGSAIQKVIALLNWMHSDFILGGPAALFASLYFAPSAPRRGMLKSLRSANRERALEGVRNAAWDITHISEFVRRVSEEDCDTKRFLLATSDKSLAHIASSLFHYGDELDGYESLASRLCNWWEGTDAENIARAFASNISRLDDPMRMTNNDTQDDYIARLIAAGEQRLREWQPT